MPPSWAWHLGDADAQRYFDRVRTRAGLATKPLTIDNLIDERRVEFVGEGKRYFDLVRTDKAASVLTAGGGVILQSGGALNETTGLQDTDNMVWSGQAIDGPSQLDSRTRSTCLSRKAK